MLRFQLTASALSELKAQHPAITFTVLDIDSLWQTLQTLSDDVLKVLFDSGSPEELPARMAEEILDLRQELSTGNAKTQDAINQLPRDIEFQVNNAVRSAMAESYQGAEHLKSINQKRFDRARQELVKGSIVSAEKSYRELVTDLESQGPVADSVLIFRSYTNLGSSLWQQFRRDEAVIWFGKAYRTRPHDPKAQMNLAISHVHRKEFQAALAILRELEVFDSNSFEVLYLTSYAYIEQGDVTKAVAILEDRPLPTTDYFVALAEAYLRLGTFPKAIHSARSALTRDKDSTGALIALANGLGFPFVQRRMSREPTAFSPTPEEHQQVLEAIKACEAAAVRLKAEDRFLQLGELLTNLSAFYELVGDDLRAAETAQEAAKYTPENTTTLHNLWASQMRFGKYVEAYHTAAQLKQGGEKLTGKLHQLESLLIDSKYERVLKESEEEVDLMPELLSSTKFLE